MEEKAKRYFQRVSEVLELIAAGLVLVGVLLSMVGLIRNIGIFREMLTEITSFKIYLEEILSIVIGIEFLEMLCRPNSDNVMEVLIFLVARHMIVGDTSPYMDFVSVISVAILCFMRRYLHVSREKEKNKVNKSLDEL